MWQIRPYTEADLPGMLVVENRWREEAIALEDLPKRIEQRRKAGPYQRLVAVQDGHVIGLGWAGVSFTRQGYYDLQVVVGAEWEGLGVGFALYQPLEGFAREGGAIGLEAFMRDDQPGWKAWAERLGFAYRTQFFRSELPLAGFDPAPFRGALDRATAAGYTFKSLPELPEEEAQRAYYAIDCEGLPDEPDWVEGWQETPWEVYRERTFAGSHYYPAGIFFALKDGDYVAVTGLHHMTPEGMMPTSYSGVRRAHRGYGLAQALKLLAVEHAIAAGAKVISTHNNAQNGPMLAINRKFGFQPQPGLYVVEKKL